MTYTIEIKDNRARPVIVRIIRDGSVVAESRFVVIEDAEAWAAAEINARSTQ